MPNRSALLYYLYQRPIGVLMTFLALLSFSLLALMDLPIALLPDIDSPKLIISLKKEGLSPDRWEENVMGNLRQILRPASQLKNLTANSVTGSAQLMLEFESGTNMDLAFLEVNEKIDRFYAENSQLDERPLVIRQNASDIPVIKIQVIPIDSSRLSDASEIVNKIISRRLESLYGIAMVDISGLRKKAIYLQVNQHALIRQQLDMASVLLAIREANIPLSSVTVQSGKYEYDLEIDARLTKANDLLDIPLKLPDNTVLPLSEFASVSLEEIPPSGLHIYNGWEGIVMNIHRQSGSDLRKVVELVKSEVIELEKEFPNLAFHLSRDQSIWLISSFENVNTSLLYGGVFAIGILFLFVGNWRLGVIMAINVPVTVMISFLGFWLFDLSLNLISLAGLALGIGMLIDNTIIVIDNIDQSRKDESNLLNAAYKGTSEVIAPLLSSTLTTLAVFVPLLLLGETAGVLFRDQALSVSLVLSTSLGVSFLLTPVLFIVMGKKTPQNIQTKSMQWLSKGYKIHSRFLFRFPWTLAVVVIVLLGTSWMILKELDVTGMPLIENKEWKATINWSETPTLQENKKRNLKLVENIGSLIDEFEVEIASTDFFLTSESVSPLQSVFYFTSKDHVSGKEIEDKVRNLLFSKYPGASLEFGPAPNIFDQLFTSNEPYYEIKFRPQITSQLLPPSFVDRFKKQWDYLRIEETTGFQQGERFSVLVKENTGLLPPVDKRELVNQAEILWRNAPVTRLNLPGEFINVYIQSNKNSSISYPEKDLNQTLLKDQKGNFVSLNQWLEVKQSRGVIGLSSDEQGVYQSVILNEPLHSQEQQEIATWAENSGILTSFTGRYFSEQAQIKQLYKIMGLSLLLLYLILCAQFESFVQPLLILIPVPLGLCGSLLVLFVSESSISIMAAMGMIIASGIMVNDSILKVDTLNRSKRNFPNKPIQEIIQEVGMLRLKPIVMTTLTTLLAIFPILLGSGLGASLQRDMVLSIIGGLLAGTYLSIFLLPRMYRLAVGY